MAYSYTGPIPTQSLLLYRACSYTGPTPTNAYSYIEPTPTALHVTYNGPTPTNAYYSDRTDTALNSSVLNSPSYFMSYVCPIIQSQENVT